LSAVRDCLSIIFAATLLIWRLSHPHRADTPCRGDWSHGLCSRRGCELYTARQTCSVQLILREGHCATGKYMAASGLYTHSQPSYDLDTSLI
jgi:hypothetical protein